MEVLENLRDAFYKTKNRQRRIYFLPIAMRQILWALYLHTFFEPEYLVRVSFSNERFSNVGRIIIQPFDREYSQV